LEAQFPDTRTRAARCRRRARRPIDDGVRLTGKDLRRNRNVAERCVEHDLEGHDGFSCAGGGRTYRCARLALSYPLIAIRLTFCCAAGDCGRRMVNRPFLNEALTLSSSTSSTGLRRSNRP